MSRQHFPCPGCAAHLSCLASRAGQKIRCPRCGQAVLVPAAPLSSPWARRGLYLGLIGAAGGIGLTIACSLFFWGNTPPDDRPPQPVAPPHIQEPVTPTLPPPLTKKTDDKDKAKTPAPKPLPADHTRILLDQLNYHRLAAGLSSLAMDADLSRQCRQRAELLARKETAAPGEVTVEREPPSWTLVVRHRDDPGQAIDNLLARLASRLCLLQPGLKTMGLGLFQDKERGWVTVLQSPGGDHPEPDPVIYPAANQRDVPLAFAGGREIPGGDSRKMTAGFPTTLTFAPGRNVQNVQARLEDAQGKQVNAWLSTPEKPAQPHGQRNSIALIAWEALQPAATYRVHVDAQVDGQKWSRTWSFQTIARREGDEALTGELLAKINEYRQQAGLEKVTLDPSLSPGCLAHARYLVRNLHHRATLGLGAHDEDLALPGATPEGKKAGNAAVIAIEDPDPLTGLHGLMATLYHRVALLHPDLKRIGVGCAQSSRLRWTTVVDVQRGRETGSWKKPIFFPIDGQTAVPLAFPVSGEEPDPIPEDRDGQAGYPITATFPSQTAPRKAVAILAEDGGPQVPVWFSSPEKPANPQVASRQGSTICLIPKDPLRPGTMYRVSLSGEVNGQPWQARWRFSTMAHPKTTENVQLAMVAKINRARQAAGLKPVELAPLLAQGCAAHAEYLVRHAELRVARKLQINSEDPNLPAFTPQGLAASRQADFLFNAPSPLLQVDELLATFFRRVYLLDPALRRVGFGCAFDPGRGWVCVLDLVGGRQEEVFLYPAPGQKAVPCPGLEKPAGAEADVGYLITVTFQGRPLIKDLSLVLKDASGQAIPVTLAHNHDQLWPGCTYYLIPRHPLQPKSTYQVSGLATVSGRSWQQDWQFTTSPNR